MRRHRARIGNLALLLSQIITITPHPDPSPPYSGGVCAGPRQYSTPAMRFTGRSLSADQASGLHDHAHRLVLRMRSARDSHEPRRRLVDVLSMPAVRDTVVDEQALDDVAAAHHRLVVDVFRDRDLPRRVAI